MIGNTFLFISFLGNIINTLCVLSLTLIFLKDAFRLPINKLSPNQTAQRLQRRAEKNYVKIVVFFLFSFEWHKKFAQKLSFYIIFTINILSAESSTESPNSGCEAATRCTKTYTVSLLQTIKVCFLIEREKASQAR